QDEADPCAAPTVLTKNCRFQKPVWGAGDYGVVYHDWNPYVLSGTPQFDVLYHGNSYDPDDMVNGGREQSIHTTSGVPWRAGLWQQIDGVKPGDAYFARIGWFVAQNISIVGRVGIDPYGGTNPTAASVVWSSALNLQRQTRINVRGVYALNTRITIFVEANSTTPSPAGDRIWVTAVSVSPDALVPTATPTPLPPTATNTRPPATRTSTPLPATATAVPTNTPIPTATATATDTPTATATATPTATVTPTATSTRRLTVTPTPTPAFALSAVGAGIALGMVGATGCGSMFALALSVVGVWFWRARKQVG
ncbi:MAG: ATP synthase subunit C, partial [Chloroflexota bacterium]